MADWGRCSPSPSSSRSSTKTRHYSSQVYNALQKIESGSDADRTRTKATCWLALHILIITFEKPKCLMNIFPWMLDPESDSLNPWSGSETLIFRTQAPCIGKFLILKLSLYLDLKILVQEPFLPSYQNTQSYHAIIGYLPPYLPTYPGGRGTSLPVSVLTYPLGGLIPTPKDFAKTRKSVNGCFKKIANIPMRPIKLCRVRPFSTSERQVKTSEQQVIAHWSDLCEERTQQNFSFKDFLCYCNTSKLSTSKNEWKWDWLFKSAFIVREHDSFLFLPIIFAWLHELLGVVTFYPQNGSEIGVAVRIRFSAYGLKIEKLKFFFSFLLYWPKLWNTVLIYQLYVLLYVQN